MWLNLTPAGIFEQNTFSRLYNMDHIIQILNMENMKGAFMIYDDETYKIVKESRDEIEEMLKRNNIA